jgi:hypothetical protein
MREQGSVEEGLLEFGFAVRRALGRANPGREEKKEVYVGGSEEYGIRYVKWDKWRDSAGERKRMCAGSRTGARYDMRNRNM